MALRNSRPIRPLVGSLVLALTLLTTGCVGISRAPRPPVAMSAEQRVAHNRKVFERAWDLVNRKFFDAKFRGVDWNAMRDRYRPDAEKAADDDGLYAAINQMLRELKESHVSAMPPQRWFEQHTRQRALVGLGFSRVEGRWVVTHVYPGSPAEAAGVQRGWLAVARDGRALEEQKFRLTEGQTVVYEFLDERDQPHALTMTAKVISTVSLPEARELADGVVYLRFDDFNLKSLRWLSEQLRAHRASPAVVIDLRNNPGGFLFSLDFALGEFFPREVPMGTFVRRSGTKNEEGASQLFSARYAGRVALLVGPATASCSEIFTHALRYHGRAVVIGQKTAGAVILSRDYPLPDGGRVQVAVEDYVGLDGKRIEGVGVTPDFEVPIKLSDLRTGVDAELNTALSQLRQPLKAVAQSR
ncbi:MAG TPA: S41 family peptidase [Opitutaceae bacterium]|nr:S41 family peptidase [Opitutaceae bacterium]